MRFTLSTLLLVATIGLLAGCSKTPPSTDDVRAARQAWFTKRGEGEYTLKSVDVTAVNCAPDGDKFVCSGHEAYVTLHKARHVGTDGSTVVDLVPHQGEDDFKTTLAKGDKGWISTD